MDMFRPNGVIGSDRPRIDGADKVTGRALYGDDQKVADPAYAYLVTSTITRGRVTGFDQSALAGLPVHLVLTHENVGRAIKDDKQALDGGYMSHSKAPLGSDQIHFSGQIVAVVVAETFEAAHAGAELLRVSYEPHAATASFDDAGAKEVKAKAYGEAELSAGDFNKAYAQAPVTFDAWYETPPQHHNPMELFQSTCVWEGEELTVYESTQNVRGNQRGLAKQLGISHKQVRFISPFIGGAFGSRGELGQATALVALAAKRLNRPVRLVASRRQGFTLRTFRAETRHHLRLGADRDGRLTALSHDSWELTARTDRFALAGSDSTARLYACPNVRTLVKNVEADRQPSGFMRAPPETPYLFAMESAMDELAAKLNLDPLELRRRNETQVETVTNKPYTSRSLLQCMDAGARAFGWDRREPHPGSMRDGDELVGWGYASAFYPTMVGPSDCRLTLGADAKLIVEVGTHEIGTGVRTVVAQTAADFLGLEPDAVEVRIGDSTLPAAPMSAGSNTTASVCTVVAIASRALAERVAQAASQDEASPLHGVDPKAITFPQGHAEAGNVFEPVRDAIRRASRGRSMVETATTNPHGAPPVLGPMLIRRGMPVIFGGAMLKDRMQFAFGAQFVEVRIDRHTGQIRVPRTVGAFAAGRIMNPRTARSQLMGGQVWGLSSALHEATEIDRNLGRYVNADLAEYHVPVCADIGDVQTIMLDEEDRLVNPLGIKGVGELGITGVNAAVANAVFHATGVRVRKLPIRIEAVLASALVG